MLCVTISPGGLAAPQMSASAGGRVDANLIFMLCVTISPGGLAAPQMSASAGGRVDASLIFMLCVTILPGELRIKCAAPDGPELRREKWK